MTQPLTAKLLNMAKQPFLQALLIESDSCYLGKPLSDLPEDLVAEFGPSQELLATIIEEAFSRCPEAVRTLAALMEEV